MSTNKKKPGKAKKAKPSLKQMVRVNNCTHPIFARRRDSGPARYYGDFRSYKDVGGKMEPLVAPREKFATTDLETAKDVYATRLAQLADKRRGDAEYDIEEYLGLGDLFATHMERKSSLRRKRPTDQELGKIEKRLTVIGEFFGVDRDPMSVTQDDLDELDEYLGTLPGRGDNDNMSDGTKRHYFTSLSNVYKLASGKNVVRGYNPVSGWEDMPQITNGAAEFFEVHEIALMLEALQRLRRSRLLEPGQWRNFNPAILPLIATYPLTGMRKSEATGLLHGDISFNRKVLTVRQNQLRRVKTYASSRPVPLFPQLEEFYDEYLTSKWAPKGTLFFPSPSNPDAMITDFRKPLDMIAYMIGMPRGSIRTKMFRHTYCAARLQTLDNGFPIATYTVESEMGHGGPAMVRKVYGHLGTIRQRSDVVEYRHEHYRKELSARMRAMKTPNEVARHFDELWKEEARRKQRRWRGKAA